MMFKSLLSIIMLCTWLVGCGTTGPLYIPEQRYPLPDEPQAPAVSPDNQPTQD
jgi:predicted small lipoprotein YifL